MAQGEAAEVREEHARVHAVAVDEPDHGVGEIVLVESRLGVTMTEIIKAA